MNRSQSDSSDRSKPSGNVVCFFPICRCIVAYHAPRNQEKRSSPPPIQCAAIAGSDRLQAILKPQRFRYINSVVGRLPNSQFPERVDRTIAWTCRPLTAISLSDENPSGWEAGLGKRTAGCIGAMTEVPGIRPCRWPPRVTTAERPVLPCV